MTAETEQFRDIKVFKAAVTKPDNHEKTLAISLFDFSINPRSAPIAVARSFHELGVNDQDRYYRSLSVLDTSVLDDDVVPQPIPVTPENICKGLNDLLGKMPFDITRTARYFCNGNSPTNLFMNAIGSVYRGVGEVSILRPSLVELPNERSQIARGYGVAYDLSSPEALFFEQAQITSPYDNTDDQLKITTTIDPGVFSDDYAYQARRVRQVTDSRGGDNFIDVSDQYLHFYKLHRYNTDMLAFVQTLVSPSEYTDYSAVLRLIFADPTSPERSIQVTIQESEAFNNGNQGRFSGRVDNLIDFRVNELYRKSRGN